MILRRCLIVSVKELKLDIQLNNKQKIYITIKRKDFIHITAGGKLVNRREEEFCSVYVLQTYCIKLKLWRWTSQKHVKSFYPNEKTKCLFWILGLMRLQYANSFPKWVDVNFIFKARFILFCMCSSGICCNSYFQYPFKKRTDRSMQQNSEFILTPRGSWTFSPINIRYILIHDSGYLDLYKNREVDTHKPHTSQSDFSGRLAFIQNG